MKRSSVVIVIGMVFQFIVASAYAQKGAGIPRAIIIEPYSLQVTFNKTTNLIFPYTIKSVDRGSRDVLVQKAGGSENVLLVKAGRENFRETNLSVITSDGKLYSFILNYSTNPSLLNLSFTKDSLNATLLPVWKDSEALLQATAEQVVKKRKMIYGIKDCRYKMVLQLEGLYIRGDVLFFQVEVQNRANINYDTEMLRFFIRDLKRAKRTASQEIEVEPMLVYGDTAVIKGGSANILVFALPRFTIPDKKYLAIQLMERNGGRHLHLNLHNRTLIKAKRIED